jgi:hypothetical protein
MADPKILIAITSAHANADRRRVIRETWLRELPPEVSPVFVLGQGPELPENDLLHLPVPDSRGALPRRTSAFIKHALCSMSFDFLFKCEDDTFVVPKRLQAFATSNLDFVGSTRSFSRAGTIPEGAGIWLSRRAAEILAQTLPPLWGQDGEWIQHVLKKAGISLTRSSQLIPDSSAWPDSGNNLITCHWVDGAMMRAIQRALEPVDTPIPMLCFRATHRSWSSDFCLYPDGIFLGGSWLPHGTWSISPDGRTLTLQWFCWEQQTLHRTAHGFADNLMSLDQLP